MFLQIFREIVWFVEMFQFHGILSKIDEKREWISAICSLTENLSSK